MKLNQMRAFRELMLTGSVSEAARNLHRSQPAVSALIAGLERELDMPLFERRRGRLHPVPEAHYLHEECAELLRRVDAMRQNLRRVRELEVGEIRIVSMPGPSVFVLPDIVSRFVADRPGIRSTLISRSSEAVMQLVAAQRFDVGVSDLPLDAPAESSLMHVERVAHECLCALPADDPLAARETITPDDLAGRPLAALQPEHETSRGLVRAFADAGHAPDIRFTGQYFVPLLTYVERGLAAAIVDPLTRRAHALYRGPSGPIRFLPFRPAIGYGTAILTPAHRTPSLLIRAFTERLGTELRGESSAVDPS